jgi:hypothetical protein
MMNMGRDLHTGAVTAVLGLAVSLACSRPAAEEPGPRTAGAGERFAPAVVIDGRFDEWPDGSGGSWGDVEVRDDPGAVYFAMTLPRQDNIQGLDGAALLVVDADGDATTGTGSFGVPGADIVISFTRLVADEDPQHGIVWWRPDPSDPDRVFAPRRAGDPYGLGLWFEPRHTSVRVEVRLARDRPDPGLWNGSVVSGRFVHLDRDGGVRGSTPSFRHTFRTPRSARAVPRRADLGRADGTDFRLVSWNVSRDRIVRDPDAARGILAALAPDLVLLDEVPPGVSAADIIGVLPGGARAGWAVHVGTSGGRQRGAIAVRGSVEAAAPFERVAYDESVSGIAAGSLATDLREVVSNSAAAGVPVAGAWVTHGGRRWLAVTLDLVCCGNSPRSVQDLVRRIEAHAINEATKSALASEPPGGPPRSGAGTAALLVGGDFNLVGSREPLDAVAAGVGRGGSDLESVYALQLDNVTSATWTSDGQPFPPGQLDYVLYEPERLSALRAFVFETLDLPGDQLTELGLTAGDSDRASDHRPIVVDFAWQTAP